MIAVLAQRRLTQKRLSDAKEVLSGMKFQNQIPAELEQILKKAPLLKSDGSFAYTTRGCIPDPAIIERKLAVAVTLDSKVLGYVPTQEAGEMHKYLLAHSSGVRARAKIYLGSRPEYNGVMLDFAKPLRLESRRR